jgi:hypothetical protein
MVVYFLLTVFIAIQLASVFISFAVLTGFFWLCYALPLSAFYEYAYPDFSLGIFVVEQHCPF